MTELSPQAQAVLEAYREASDGCYVNGEWIQDHAGQIAAAFRAAADQVVPEMEHPEAEEWLGQSAWLQAKASVRFRLLAIAAELEGAQAEQPRRRIFPTPHQIAECGGPCEQGGPEACDCGLYEHNAIKLEEQMYFPRQPFHAPVMLRAMADALESHPITEPSFSASPGVVLSTEDDIHGVRMSFSCNVMAEMDEFKETVAEAYKRYSGKPAPWSIEANPTSQEH